MSLGQDLNRFTVKVTEASEEKIRGNLLSFTKLVIEQTPVDTGRLRGNWQSSINQAKLSQITTQQKGLSGAASDEAQKTIAQFELGDIFFFTNNLPYARVVEFGLYPNPPKKGKGKTVGGFSTLAPQGMVRPYFRALVRALQS
jgi:hypothetical protein